MAENSDFSERRWTLSEIALAADGNPHTYKTWIQRGLIVAAGPRAPLVQGPGLANLYSTLTALQLAVAGALSRGGCSAELSAKAGERFAHNSDGEFTWEGEPTTLLNRVPGGLFQAPEGLFESDRTYVLACPQTGAYRVTHSSELERALREITIGHTGAAVALLDMSELQPSVLFRLGHTPR